VLLAQLSKKVSTVANRRALWANEDILILVFGTLSRTVRKTTTKPTIR
jgi:hypothetical protein